MATINRRNSSRTLTVVEPVHYHPYSFVDEIEMLARNFWDEWEPVTYGDEGIPMEMFERKDELFLKVEVPGIKKEDININLDDRLLTVTAEKKQSTSEQNATYYFGDVCYGEYSRSVMLPFPVDANKITTTFDNGILEILFPKSVEAKAKHIEISLGSSPRALSSRSTRSK